jgi:hypothetical protein
VNLQQKHRWIMRILEILCWAGALYLAFLLAGGTAIFFAFGGDSLPTREDSRFAVVLAGWLGLGAALLSGAGLLIWAALKLRRLRRQGKGQATPQ